MHYLSAEQIKRIHDRVVQATGGSLGLREPNLLLAIAEKPKASFGGEDLYATMYEKAAAVYEALCNYHVFVDGNKRTALVSLEYMLETNGFRLVADSKERERFTLEVAASRPSVETVAAWIREYTEPTKT